MPTPKTGMEIKIYSDAVILEKGDFLFHDFTFSYFFEFIVLIKIHQ